jgi:ankyrin repeat protein
MQEAEETLLITAVQGGFTDVVRSLLASGQVNVNTRDKYKQSILMHAVYDRHVEIVNLLLQEKAIDVNLKDNEGWTPLMWCWDIHIFNILLMANADIETTNNAGLNVLMLNVLRGNADIINLILKDGRVNINNKNKYGRTALMYAVREEHVEILKSLLENENIDINVKDKDGWTALMLAVNRRNVDSCKLLCEKGARVDTHQYYPYDSEINQLLKSQHSKQNALVLFVASETLPIDILRKHLRRFL